MAHIAIIGAGITGVTTAWSLVRLGHQVTIFDKNRYPAMETSFANGGQLSASNAEVWNHWSSVLKGIKWMMRPDAPLKFNLSPSWHKYSWMAEFLGNIPNYERNTIATARLAVQSRAHMFDMAREADIAFDLEKRGILHFYGDQKSYENAARVNALLSKGGLERKAVTPDEMREIEPALSGKFHGGFYTKSDSTGDIHKFTTGLADAVNAHGGTFIAGANVRRLATTQGGITVYFDQAGEKHTSQFDSVVICAGVASREFASQLGDSVNIYPVKGYSITVQLGDQASQNAAPWTSLLDDEAKIVTSRLGADRFRVAGTAEFAGFNKDITATRIAPLIDWCARYFPAMRTEHVVPWAGLRPMMPNMMPRVGKGRAPGVYYNTGHGHLGWTLSAATAHMIAGQIDVDRKPQTVRVVESAANLEQVGNKLVAG